MARYTITFDVELVGELDPGDEDTIPGSDRWYGGPWTAERFLAERIRVVPELREWQHELVRIGPATITRP